MATMPTLRLNSQGPAVKILQMNLYGLNFNYNGIQINGVFDDLTKEVVRDFQAENRLVPDGIVGPVTWNVLLLKVKKLQNRLNALGFSVGVSDGIYGRRTTDAVRRFQSINGLLMSGIVNPRTRQKLFNPYPKDNFAILPSSTSLNALHPFVAALARRFLDLCNSKGIKVAIIITFRSWNEQDEIYTMGRTKPGTIVTNAQGGDSYHNWGLAFDCAPIVNGVIDWNATDKFAKMGELGQEVGLEWGGNWKTFAINIVDMPHFQYTFGLSTEELLNGARP